MRILIVSMLGLALMAPGLSQADHGVKRNQATGGEQRCRNASDPARCEARAAAKEACKAKPEAEQPNCVAEHVCAGAKNPDRCRSNEISRSK